jgi:hypothetical protein
MKEFNNLGNQILFSEHEDIESEIIKHYAFTFTVIGTLKTKSTEDN